MVPLVCQKTKLSVKKFKSDGQCTMGTFEKRTSILRIVGDNQIYNTLPNQCTHNAKSVQNFVQLFQILWCTRNTLSENTEISKYFNINVTDTSIHFNE